jgi:hypothetical protein
VQHGNRDWEVFELEDDNPVAERLPEKSNELLVSWNAYVKDTGVV